MQRCGSTQSNGERPHLSFTSEKRRPENGWTLVKSPSLLVGELGLKSRSSRSCLALLSTLGLKYEYSEGNGFDYTGNVYECKGNCTTKLASQKAFISYTRFLIVIVTASHGKISQCYLILSSSSIHANNYLGVINKYCTRARAHTCAHTPFRRMEPFSPLRHKKC